MQAKSDDDLHGGRSSGVTGGRGEGRGKSAPPPRLLTGKFLLTYREARKKGKRGEN